MAAMKKTQIERCRAENRNVDSFGHQRKLREEQAVVHETDRP